MMAVRIFSVVLVAMMVGCSGADPAAEDPADAVTALGGTGLTSTSWTEGDPAKLYPYVTAYFYRDALSLEVEFSAVPTSQATGRRIVLICRPDLSGEGIVTTELCGWAEIRTERSCSKRIALDTFPMLQPVTTTTHAPGTVSGHVDGVTFAGLGTLTVDLAQLPIVSGVPRVCADGTL